MSTPDMVAVGIVVFLSTLALIAAFNKEK